MVMTKEVETATLLQEETRKREKDAKSKEVKEEDSWQKKQ